MARAYGKIETTFWQNPKVRALSEPGRYLLAYLFACPHGNSIGCFRLPLGYAQDDLMWPSERVRKHMAEVVKTGMADYDETTSIVRLTGWFGHNTVENQNVAKAAIRAVNALPSGRLRNDTIAALKALDNGFINAVLTSIETRSERVPTPEPEPEPEPEPDIPPEATPLAPKGARAIPTHVGNFEAWWTAYPRKRGKAVALKAYRKALQSGVSPAELLAGAERYAAERAGEDKKFTAHPASWLNAGRWTDEPEKAHERDHVADTAKRRTAILQSLGLVGGEPGEGGHDAPMADCGDSPAGPRGGTVVEAGDRTGLRGGDGPAAGVRGAVRSAGAADGGTGDPVPEIARGRSGGRADAGDRRHAAGLVVQETAVAGGYPAPRERGDGAAERAEAEGQPCADRGADDAAAGTGAQALPGHDAGREGAGGSDDRGDESQVRVLDRPYPAANAELTSIPPHLRRASA